MPGTLREFLEDFFSEAHESQGSKGLEYVFTCPFCGRQKRLWINSISLRWVCYGCRPEGGRLAGYKKSRDLPVVASPSVILESSRQVNFCCHGARAPPFFHLPLLAASAARRSV